MRKTMFVLVAVLMAQSLLAQAWRGTARLQGTVTDDSGKPVAGAKVTLVSVKAGNAGPPPITTDKRGNWAALGLIGGQWQIDIDAPGFRPGRGSVQVSEAGRIPPLKTKLQRMPEAQPAQAEQVAPVATGVPEAVVEAVRAGEALMKEEKWKEAIEQFQIAHSALPDNMQLKQVLAQAHYRAGDLPKAISLLEEVSAADPANTGTALLLVNVYLENSQLDNARTLLAMLPDDAITDPTIYTNIGILFLNKQKPADAHNYFDKAIALDGDRPEVYYYRALASIQVNNRTAAKTDLLKVIELAPDSAEARDSREMLKSLQ